MFKRHAVNSADLPQDVADDLQALQQAGHLTAAEAAKVARGVLSAQRARTAAPPESTRIAPPR